MSTNTELARLLQLASPTLPVGAFSYSQGLEAAVEAGIVTREGLEADPDLEPLRASEGFQQLLRELDHP